MHEDLGFTPQQAHSDIGFIPSQSPSKSAINPYKSLLTNEPIEGITNYFMRGLPASIGGIVGGSAAAIPGAILGGAAGESARQGAVNIASTVAGGRISDKAEIFKNIGIQGIAGGVAEGAGQLVGMAAKGLVRPASQALRILTGTPEKYGMAALKNPSILSNAPTASGVNAAYREFEQGAGLTSPKLARALGGELVEGDAAALGSVKEAAKYLTPFIDKEASKASISGNVVYDLNAIRTAEYSGNFSQEAKQALYEGSQAASHLKSMAKAGSPKEIANTANIDNAKQAFDNALELVAPGYKAARQAAFENATKDAFSSFFPLSQNQSTNQLRGYTSLITGIGSIPSALSGNATAMIGVSAPFIQSPMMWGLGLQGASKLAPLAAVAAKGVRFAPGSIAAYYNSPQAQK